MSTTRWADDSASYIRWLKGAGRSPATITKRRGDLSTLARWAGARSPRHLGLEDLGEFMSTHAQLKPASRAALRCSLRDFFAWQVLTGRRSDNPAARLPAITVPHTARLPVPMSDYYLALYRAEGRPDVQLMLQLGRFAGLRRAEIAGLRAEDVDWSSNVVRVEGKGGRTRLVPMHPDLEAQLRRFLAGRGAGWVFRNSVTGDKYRPHTVGVLLADAMPAGWSAHDLRRRFGSDVYSASGNSLIVTQQLLGHADVSTTMLYVSVSEDAKRAAVAGLAR